MTLGAPPKSIGIRLDRDRGSSSSIESSTTYPRYRFTTEYAVTTNPESVEHTDGEDRSLLTHSQTPRRSVRDQRATSTAHVDFASPSRSKASTPGPSSGQSAHASPLSYDEEIDSELEERGRKRTRLECIVPPRSRKISKKSIERHISQSTRGSRPTEGVTFLTSESPSPTESNKEDLILEPSPGGFVRALSERLSEQGSPASPEEGVPFSQRQWAADASFKKSEDANRLSAMEPTYFQNHRDTFAILDLPKNKPLPASPPELSNIPYPLLRHVDVFLDRRSRLALRLTCKWLNDAIGEIRPLQAPAVSRLPAEMIHEVLTYLSPFDFNNARHTCRTWMRVSLDKNLLARMFRKAGWWTSVEKEMRGYLVQSGADEDDFPAVWHLSSLLARECSFTSFGSGKGLPNPLRCLQPTPKFAQMDGAVEESTPNIPRLSPFEQILETDFSALRDAKMHANAVPTYAQARGLRDSVHFTTSVCGRFVLVANRNQIFVYRLFHAFPDEMGKSGNTGAKFPADSPTPQDASRTASIYPVTTIICPRRVLAVSMDTSCGRYAVAALLDDRMGLVCDLFGSTEPTSTSNSSNEAPAEPIAVHPHRESQPAYTSIVTPGLLQSGSSSLLFRKDSPTLIPQLLPTHSDHKTHISYTYPIPIETGPRSIYRALCSSDDPPLSIAICPQRRCVAFGCSSGIELHWVDALTGQDLNRWFPLTAPSDYLFFLPPRQGIDNAKKLRLVSSSGLSGMQGRLRERFTTSRPYNWGARDGVGFGYGSWRDNEEVGRDTAENYQSVPLSNGYHVLYTDPIDQKLCLGIDAPGFGPNRMAKKIVFDGPKGFLPSLYTAGSDLSWGVRVVAGYGDEIWLFTVPEDIFTCDSNGEGEPWLEQYVPAGRLAHLRSLRAARALLVESPTLASLGKYDSSEDLASIWPIVLPGVLIATVHGLVEIAINSRPASFTLWAFASDGIAKAWQVRGGKPRNTKVTKVSSDGSVVEERHHEKEDDIHLMQYGVKLDPDGDVIMEDASPTTEIAIPGLEWTSHTSFDGYMSRHGSLNPMRRPSRRFSTRAGHEAPPTTPATRSPASPATPILQGVDAALREPSASPVPSASPMILSNSTRSASSPRTTSSALPDIIEHEFNAIDAIISSDLDDKTYWASAEEDARKEAVREQVVGFAPEKHVMTGRVYPDDARENGDFYGLGYGLGEEQDDDHEGAQLEIEIWG